MPTKTTRKTATAKSNVARPKSKSALNAKFTFSKTQLAIVIGLILVIGGIIVWRVLAATSQTEVETWSASGGNVKTVADNTASGGSYAEFGAPSTTTGLPAGVTLQAPDGGHNYRAKFTNGLPNDKNFFPISVFSPYDLAGVYLNGKTKVQSYAEAGINTLFSPANGACGDVGSQGNFIDIAKANGMYVFADADKGTCGVDDAAYKTKYKGTLVGYVYQDELEGNPCSSLATAWLKPYCKDDGSHVSGQGFIDMSNAIRTVDTTREVGQGFTQGYALDWYINGTQLQLAKSSDELTYDIYSLTDLRCYPAYDGCGKPWGYYTHVTSARNGSGGVVPIWPDLETSAVFSTAENPKQYQPTPADVKATAMNAIVAGAGGIQWFKNCFCNVAATQDTFTDSRYASVNTAIGQVDAQIKRLAYVINSDFANGYFTKTGNVSATAKYDDRDGSFYIFATAHQDASQSVSFTVKAGSSVTVFDEGRTLPLTNGLFTDIFANGTAYHIYKISR